MKFFQKLKPRHTFTPFVSTMMITYRPMAHLKPKLISPNLSIDQFFSESHNLHNGDVNTSPLMFDDPQASSHLSPIASEPSRTVNMTDDEIHASVIPKSIQTKAEVSKLANLRPAQDDEEKPIELPSEPTQDPSPSPAPSE